MNKSFTVKGTCTVTWDEEDFLEESDGHDKEKARKRLQEFNPTDELVIQTAQDMYNIHDMDCVVEQPKLTFEQLEQIMWLDIEGTEKEDLETNFGHLILKVDPQLHDMQDWYDTADPETQKSTLVTVNGLIRLRKELKHDKT